jgi:Icc-related predicted phosphoesterase
MLEGNHSELQLFYRALKRVRQNYKHIVVVPGNHDKIVESDPDMVAALLKQSSITLLIDKGIVIGGKKFYGSPWSPFCGYWAFQYDNEEAAEYHWSKIPANTDFLITHTPPHTILDLSASKWATGNSGCPVLARHVERVKPKFHAFGHIHEGYGMVEYASTTFINVASLKRDYFTQNDPVLIDFD